MRIPYGFILASDGVLNINKDEADVISMIFDFYIAGASLGKIVDTCYCSTNVNVCRNYVSMFSKNDYHGKAFLLGTN